MKRRLALAVAISSLLAVTVLATDGPLTAFGNVRIRTDENGYLRISAGTPGLTDGPLTAADNARVRTDENGYLRVSCSNCTGTVPGSTTQVIVNVAGAFGAYSNFNYDGNNFHAGVAIKDTDEASWSSSYSDGFIVSANRGYLTTSTNSNINAAVDTGMHRSAAGIYSVDNGTAGTGGMFQPGRSVQASLGTPANGTIVYCSDCTVANPCAGSGTGALAKRLNGAWVCN